MPTAPPPKLPEEKNTQNVKPTPLLDLVEPQTAVSTRRGPDSRKRRPERYPSRGLYLPLWSVVLMLLVVFGVVGGAVFLVLVLGGPTVNTAADPIILIITASPSETPPAAQSILVSPSAPFQPTFAAPAESVALSGPTLASTPTFTPTPPVIAVGTTVIVSGVNGVNVRREPVRNDRNVLFPAKPNETFLVVEGPQENDGLIWWRIRDPLDSTRTGWAAQSDGSQELLKIFVP